MRTVMVSSRCRLIGGIVGVMALATVGSACGGSAAVSSTSGVAVTSSDAPPAAGVRLSFSPSAQTELVSPEGVHVVIDVANATLLVDPFDEVDILLVTHDHPDHYDQAAVESFTGAKLDRQVGTLEMGDVKVSSLATVHNEGGPVGSDFIFIVDVGDLRVVHFGDIGVAALTADELAAVGQIDVAITQFDNSYSDVDTVNEKGFQLVEQLHPRLVIPTHQTDASVGMMTRWPCVYTEQRTVSLTRELLPQTTTVLFIGPFAFGQGKLTGAQLVDW